MTAYDLRACQSPPQVIPTVIVSSFKVLEPHGLLTVVNKIGGMPLILFLFARVNKLQFIYYLVQILGFMIIYHYFLNRL